MKIGPLPLIEKEMEYIIRGREVFGNSPPSRYENKIELL